MTESAGAGTRLTALKMNGVDYSSAISNWFGANYLSPHPHWFRVLLLAGGFLPGQFSQALHRFLCRLVRCPAVGLLRLVLGCGGRWPR